jgi:hypothetical protein
MGWQDVRLCGHPVLFCRLSELCSGGRMIRGPYGWAAERVESGREIIARWQTKSGIA